MPAFPVETFIALIEQALAQRAFVKLVLGKPRLGAGDRVRVSIRPVQLKGEARLCFVHTHPTRDVTKNLRFAEGVQALRKWLPAAFGHAHLFTTAGETQLLVSKKGRETLVRGTGGPADVTVSTPAAASATHDRAKHRFVAPDAPFLAALGVMDAQGRLVPAMARKWKQINRFVEVLDRALADAALKRKARIDVADFGSGKGYLTFAAHEHLSRALGLPVQVRGVELREDMVALCNAAVQRLGLSGLRFEEGDVREAAPQPIDIMIALHACDTATDHAIHLGVQAGASIIMCSPCCHKELRPQLLAPHPLRPVLKHGVHLGQQAEMLTDALRALLLEACGYEAQVFEFISLEHTAKNKMILAVRRPAGRPAVELWQQIRDLKGFYGIREQCLEKLLLTGREHVAPSGPP
jgi:SAM-dependent methyltransferase